MGLESQADQLSATALGLALDRVETNPGLGRSAQVALQVQNASSPLAGRLDLTIGVQYATGRWPSGVFPTPSSSDGSSVARPTTRRRRPVCCRWLHLRGSLVERFTSCHKLNCRCQDPEHRHGPYFQLSWKESGKTVSKLISADDAARYQEWIANRRRLESALEEMRDLSRKAGEYTLAKDDHQYLVRSDLVSPAAQLARSACDPPQPGISGYLGDIPGVCPLL